MNQLSQAFLIILNMSITATYVALGVMGVRAVLRKAPKLFSYLLCSVVLFRLICPLSIPLSFSFLRLLSLDAGVSSNSLSVPQYVPANIGLLPEPSVNFGLPLVDRAINNTLPVAAAPILGPSPLAIWFCIGSTPSSGYPFF